MAQHLDRDLAERVGKFLRLLGSDKPGEVLAVAGALCRVLSSAGADLHDLAASLGANGYKFTEADARKIYQEGVEDGRRAAEANIKPSDFRSVNDDGPSWHEIAKECAARSSRLRDNERRFVEDMVGWTVHGGEPTPKQAKWLRGIYARVRR
jgi:hypothetical protein